MANEIIFCPSCGQGTLDSETIEDSSSDDYIKVYYYSCGHKQEKIRISVKIGVKAELNKMVARCGNKRAAGKHQEYEIEERYRTNDKEHPEKRTVETVYINHSTDPTSVFHAVKYTESDDLKHIDCKVCENSWRYDSGSHVCDYFSFECNSEIDYPRRFKIHCLKCNAMYEV